MDYSTRLLRLVILFSHSLGHAYMNGSSTIESMRFETEELDYIETGEDFRDGTRLYDSAIVGRIHLYLDDEELLIKRRLPTKFDVSDTVRSMHEMVSEFRRTGSVSVTPFCCICGNRGCVSIRWQLEAADPGVRLKMEDFSGKQIGPNTYHFQLEALYNAIAELTENVIRAMDEANVERVTTGTNQKFINKQERLARYKSTRTDETDVV